MDETELIQEFEKARHLVIHGKISTQAAREVLLPLLILDICYGYIQRGIRVEDFRFKQRHHVKEIRKAFNHVNGWFFAGLKDELEDEAIALMDQLEDSVKLDILVCETAIWNIFKIYPADVCEKLVCCYMTYLLAAGANAAWEHSYTIDGRTKTTNRAITKIQHESKSLSMMLTAGFCDEVANESRVKALRDAEAVLGRKLVEWTRKTE